MCDLLKFCLNAGCHLRSRKGAVHIEPVLPHSLDDAQGVCCKDRIVLRVREGLGVDLGPRIADRVVSVNLLGTLVTLLICILAYLMAEDYLVDISLIYTTLSFLAVVLLTKIYMGVYRQKRHQEQKEKEDADHA